MASAVAVVKSVQPNGSDLALITDVAYVGTDILGGGQTNTVTVVVPGNAQPAAVRTAMSLAISQDAVAMGFTVLGGDMVLPSFQKG